MLVYSGCRRDDLRPFNDLAHHDVGRRLASYGQDDTGSTNAGILVSVQAPGRQVV